MSVSTNTKETGNEVVSSNQADDTEHISLPFQLPMLQRSPHSILWHKVGLEQRATTGKAIEQEIKMKLSFLQKIYKKRREGSNNPGPRICGGMEAAPPGSEQLRRLQD